MSANDGSSMQMRTHPTFTIPAASDIVYDATSKEASRRTGDMSMSRAKQAFVTRPEYRQCTPISDFIATNYRLPSNTKNRSGKDEASKSVYLDFGGAGLPMHTVLKKEYQLFATSVFGNPHSCSPSSMLSSKYVELARTSVLSFFNVTSASHECVWTAGTSSAVSMLRQLYFEDVRHLRVRTRVIILDDVHNSVNGIRTVVDEEGLRDLVTVTFIPIDIITLRVDEAIFMSEINTLAPDERGLVLFTAQSNLSGVVHPLRLLKSAKEHGWHTLLDAACYVPTTVLDLAAHDFIDFVPVSWYKIVGHPTGLGSLIIKQSALSCLRKNYFAGGTVATISNDSTGAHILHPMGYAALEDGTINFRSFPALYFSLAKLLALPRPLIAQRTKLLLSWLIEHLTPLRHSQTGHPLLRIVGFPSSDMHHLQKMHGSTISMVFYTSTGKKLSSRESEALALRSSLEIRKGRMCNSSARAANPGTDDWTGSTPDELARHDWIWAPSLSQTAEDPLSRPEAKATVTMPDGQWRLQRMSDEEVGDGSSITKYGVIRVSLGLPSTFEDVYAFYAFARAMTSAVPPQEPLAASTRVNRGQFLKLLDNVKLPRRSSKRPSVARSNSTSDSDQTLAGSSGASSIILV